MSLHFPGNKPRSIHRQLPTYSSHAPIPPSLEQSLDEWLSRTGSNHSASSESSNDLGTYGNNYSHCLTQSTISTSPTTYTLSLEQQQSIYPCACCQLPQCTAWKKIAKVIRKLETETRLAAEVGQSLLQTNEAYKMELDKLKEQVKQGQEQKHAVELSLDDAECLTRQLEHEKDKWMWKYEKAQKILDESAADLETANVKCAALTKDIEQSKLEMDKLKHLKVKSYQFGTRQDILESKLQDLKQELAISRKDKLALESKYKKLTTQYETLTCSYQEKCRETLHKKRSKEPGKPLSSITPPTASDIEHASTDEVVAFVKELVSTNNELKSELLATSSQLNDLQNEMNSPEDNSQQYNNKGPQNTIGTTTNSGILLKKHLNNGNKKLAATNRAGRQSTTGDGRSTGQIAATTPNTRTRHRSALVRVSKSKSTKETRRSTSSARGPIVSPRTTSSSPVVHHHYHYYAGERQQNITNAAETMDTLDLGKIHTIDGEGKTTETTIIRPAPTTDSITTARSARNTIDIISRPTNPLADNTDTELPCGKTLVDMNNPPIDGPKPILSRNASVNPPVLPSPSDANNDMDSANTKDLTTATAPYSTLLDQAKTILHRVRATDPRTINRRLQRAFDLGELSSMSNSLLQNIMADVDTMHARFAWLAPDENDNDEHSGITNKNNEFLSMVQLFQEVLLELCQLSITINHLQVTYVSKIKENEIQAQLRHLGWPSPSSLSVAGAISSNDSTMSPPSLLPSGNTSCDSSSSKSLASFTLNNSSLISPSHWIFSLITGNRSAAASLDNNATGTRNMNLSHADVRLENNTIQQRRCFRRPGHDYNKGQFGTPMSAVIDAWYQVPPLENASSFLDREWRLCCSDIAH